MVWSTWPLYLFFLPIINQPKKEVPASSLGQWDKQCRFSICNKQIGFHGCLLKDCNTNYVISVPYQCGTNKNKTVSTEKEKDISRSKIEFEAGIVLESPAAVEHITVTREIWFIPLDLTQSNLTLVGFQRNLYTGSEPFFLKLHLATLRNWSHTNTHSLQLFASVIHLSGSLPARVNAADPATSMTLQALRT